MRPIQQSCYWFSTVPHTGEAQALAGSCDVDVAIIGAGFTGLWTAYFLQQLEPSLSIAVVENHFAGYGASGRNAGIVSASLDHSHGLAVSHFGVQEAARLAQIGLSNLKELSEFAADCDFEMSGQLQVALKLEHIDGYEESMQVALQLGMSGYNILTAEETRAQLNSPLYLGALQIDDAAIVNPIKVITKLKTQLKQSGVLFFEKTAVTKISPHLLSTLAGSGETGSVNAKHIVVATDAYTHKLLPGLAHRFIPLFDYILVSRPLSSDEKDAIGWKRRQGVVDGRTFFNYYRLTADNRILWGTSEAVYYPENRVDSGCDHSPRHYEALKASFVRHFPQLAHLSWEFEWGGPIASTTRLTPFFGSMHNGSTIYGLGYTGHGILSTRVAGKILAHMALCRPHELTKLKMVTHKPFPYPPEPLRALAVRAVTRSLQEVDAGEKPGLLLKVLDALGIGFSS